MRREIQRRVAEESDMKRAFKIFAAALLVLLFSAASFAAGEPPKTETVQFPSGKETVNGYLAIPAAPGHYPGLVLVHEWWGLNDWMKEQAQRFAEAGYVALVVDLYRGKVAETPEEAHELMRGLPQDRAVTDLEAGLEYLVTRKEVTHGDVGVVGWCMGGGLAVQLAIRQPRLAACVVNYGSLPTDPNDIQQIFAPVLGNFGALDRGITPQDVTDFEKAMKNAGRRVDVKEYEGAGHAFENENNKEGYRPEAAADAWQRTINFLNKAMH